MAPSNKLQRMREQLMLEKDRRAGAGVRKTAVSQPARPQQTQPEFLPTSAAGFPFYSQSPFSTGVIPTAGEANYAARVATMYTPDYPINFDHVFDAGSLRYAQKGTQPMNVEELSRPATPLDQVWLSQRQRQLEANIQNELTAYYRFKTMGQADFTGKTPAQALAEIQRLASMGFAPPPWLQQGSLPSEPKPASTAPASFSYPTEFANPLSQLPTTPAPTSFPAALTIPKNQPPRSSGPKVPPEDLFSIPVASVTAVDASQSSAFDKGDLSANQSGKSKSQALFEPGELEALNEFNRCDDPATLKDDLLARISYWDGGNAFFSGLANYGSYVAAQKWINMDDAQRRDFAVSQNDYYTASRIQYRIITDYLQNSSDPDIKKAVESKGVQQAAAYLVACALKADKNKQVKNPQLKAHLEKCNQLAAMSLGIDAQQETAFVKLLDNALGGAITQTSDNKGIGLLKTVRYGLEIGAAKFDDTLAKLVGTLVIGYGYLTEGTTWAWNQTLGAIPGWKASTRPAEAIKETGRGVAHMYEPTIAAIDNYLRENATTYEYLFSALVLGEGVKMAGTLYAGSGLATGAAAAPQAVQTAEQAVKASNLVHLLTALPFSTESGSRKFIEVEERTRDPLLSVGAGLIAGIVSYATSNLGVIKEIERYNLPFMPDVVKLLRANPGALGNSAIAKYGRSGLLFLFNLLKTGVNEGTQEVVEEVLTDSAVNALEGKPLLPEDIAAYGNRQLGNFLLGAISAVGTSFQSVKAYWRSAQMAQQLIGQSSLSAAQVDGFIKTFAAEAADPDVANDALEGVRQSAVATQAADRILTGGLPPIDDSAWQQAAQKAAGADEKVSFAQARAETAAAQLAKAQAQFAQNPQSKQAKMAVLKAGAIQEEAAMELAAAKVKQAAAQRALHAADDRLSQAIGDALANVTAQAEQSVSQALEQSGGLQQTDNYLYPRHEAAPVADNGPQAGTRQEALEADSAGKVAYEGMAQPEGVDGNVDSDRENRYNTFKQSVYAQIDGMRPLKIKQNLQNRHIEGTKEYILGRSILKVDPNLLVELYAGKGEIMLPHSGKWNHKEMIMHTEPVGIFKTKDGSENSITNFAIIHYSKQGVHIVPSRNREE